MQYLFSGHFPSPCRIRDSSINRYEILALVGGLPIIEKKAGSTLTGATTENPSFSVSLRRFPIHMHYD